MIEKIKDWIHNNGSTFSKIVSLAFLVFGILVIIGALRNWDWLFKPDESYQNKWTIGQLSRYLGRNTARIVGFILGVVLVVAGGVWSYMALFRK
ncbi:MAG: immunity 17 family protein [Chitinophagaceae bacterium]|nr:immunity 17 family protein [Chitinophagaceae bacterium]MBK8786685.1 immunity 17 family protein [Chitinophagaceae bacterium]